MATDQAEIQNLLDETVSILQTTKDLGKGISDFQNLPPVFSKTAEHIPSIQNAFEICKKSLISVPSGEEYSDSLNHALKECNAKVARLHEVFNKVVKDFDPKARYRTVAKDDRLENLMKAILNRMINMLKNPPFKAESHTQIQDLEQILAVFNAIDASPAGEASWHFSNTGNGTINVKHGPGQMNTNTSSGTQVVGSIGCFHAGK